jgi:AAA domain
MTVPLLPDPLPVVRAAQLKEPDAHRLWLVDSLWAHHGVGLLGGAPKCGKSWLALDLALSVASGTPCLGTFAVPSPGGALVYFAEDSAAIVKARLWGLCQQRQLDLEKLPLWVITAPSLRLDLARDQQRLEQAVCTFKPRLLLLDPFVRLHRIDENDAGQVSHLLAFLRTLQRSYDLAVLLVHHTRKNGPTGPQAGLGLRGSSDLHAWGDSNLYLRRVRDHLVLTIEHRAARSPSPLSLSLVGGDDQGPVHLQVGEPLQQGGAPQNQQDLSAQILHALSTAAAPLPRAALRATLRVRNERLGEVLQRLVVEGAVVRIGDGYTIKRQLVPIPCIREYRERNDP